MRFLIFLFIMSRTLNVFDFTEIVMKLKIISLVVYFLNFRFSQNVTVTHFSILIGRVKLIGRRRIEFSQKIKLGYWDIRPWGYWDIGLLGFWATLGYPNAKPRDERK